MKKSYIEQLEERVIKLIKENERLRRENEALKNRLRFMRIQTLHHLNPR
jgi:regulator of replication initiation timing